MKTANYEVSEIWTVECPECFEDMGAPFNYDNPMCPMKVECEYKTETQLDVAFTRKSTFSTKLCGYV